MKYLKTYESRHKYKIGDIVIIKKLFWNLSNKISTFANVLVYITYQSYAHEYIYMGIILPKKEGDSEIHFNEKDILEKISPEEAQIYIDSMKYNL